MIFHASILADRPESVARALARLWGGEALPFPFVGEGSWVAFSGSEGGNVIEIYRRGTELVPGEGDPTTTFREGAPAGSGVHLAIATELTAEEVVAVGEAEGWPTHYRKREGLFGLVEMWIDGTMLIEVLTPEMQQEYLQVMNTATYRRFLPAELGQAA